MTMQAQTRIDGSCEVDTEKSVIYALRTRVDRTFAWEDKFKRLLLRFEHMQQRHVGMKLLAYTLINLREFWGA